MKILFKYAVLIILANFLIFSFAGCKSEPMDFEGTAKEYILDKKVMEGTEIFTLDEREYKGKHLLVLMTGNEYQAHRYFFAECEEGVFGPKIVHVSEFLNRGTDLRAHLWHNEYIFVVNNEKCKALKLISEIGKETYVEVEEIPFVYYYGKMPSVYEFLDAEGEEVY